MQHFHAPKSLIALLAAAIVALPVFAVPAGAAPALAGLDDEVSQRLQTTPESERIPVIVDDPTPPPPCCTQQSVTVPPDYPLLARQMKVQGAVSLQALIARDGTIQELQIMSGPEILATAAREAVKQWHFKPYLQNGQPVETQARITVNFTISTN